MSWAESLDAIFPTRMLCSRRVAADGPEFIEPNTERWFLARRGRVTASSRAETIGLAKSLNDLGPLAQEIRAELAPDYTRTPITNAYMQWGHDHEREALANVAMELGTDFVEPGLIFSNIFPGAACTPDAFFGNEVTCQVKCPFFSKNHLAMVYTKTITRTYWYQVQFESWLSGRDQIMFASYDTRQPLPTRLFMQWVTPDHELHKHFIVAMGWLHRILDGETTPVRLTGVSGVPKIF